MGFTEACGYTLNFGPHKDESLGVLGGTDDGLKYIDRLIGSPWVESKKHTRLYEALKTYLDHPSIASRVDALVWG